MAEKRPVRWLHLSDLHLGCPGREVWWQIEEELKTSLGQWLPRLGRPDLVLLTGDLSYSGTEAQFDLVDSFLDRLLEWLRPAGGSPDPVLLAVPGNHDVRWPQGVARLNCRVLDSYHLGADDEDVALLDQMLWGEAQDASFFEPLFAPYQAWLRRRILPQFAHPNRCHLSHFPGDLSAVVDVPGAFPLLVVGLNTAWRQYKGGSIHGQLQVSTRQFQAALGGPRPSSPLAALEDCPQALLLIHHPVDWLLPKARRVFLEEIYRPERFAVCLHGHLHEARSETVSLSAGQLRYYFQAPSLLGLERYGTRAEERSMGYTWGSLSEDGQVRVWPLKRLGQGGSTAFVPDPHFATDPPHEALSGIQIRPLRQALGRAETAAHRAPDLAPYLEAVLAQTDHVNVAGLGSGEGRVRTASRYPMEDLYIPLKSRGELPGPGLEGETSPLPHGRVPLAYLLPRHPRLLVEGQPGAGKTTFLRFVATMLARDCLGVEDPGHPAWRRRYLGLGTETPPQVPVFLRLAELVPLLTPEAETGKRRTANRQRLLDLLEDTSQGADCEASRRDWQELLEKGAALLLLDGLDEVADPDLRDKVFDVFRDTCRKWRKCSVVVTSRPLPGQTLRELGFHLTTIEPFTPGEIETFVQRWVTALYQEEPGARRPPAHEDYRRSLLAAILERPGIRRLATNPVMLTCLCVVHWNEGRLPEGRSRVYRAVLRWLVRARSELRQEAGFNDFFAERAFACLALAMMAAPAGKTAILDLDEAVQAITPVLERDFPQLASQDRRHRGRAWLRFECLGSGIIEELPGHRLRFWHLTFQEYLAALELAWLGDGEEGEGEGWPVLHPHLDDPQWRETVELLPGCLLDEGGAGRVDKLLGRVLALRGEAPDLPATARVAAVMGRLLLPLTAYEYRPRPEISTVYEEALARSLALFSPQGAAQVPIEDRLPAAEALGRGGDPRLALGQDNFLPVGTESGLRLGRYPVTVEEYQRFVEAGGYGEESYWDEEGWGFRVAEGWEVPGRWEEQLQAPNRPVVTVSWYEAAAYCRWLGEQRGAESSGEEVRLPTEEEWQRAATSPRGEYPWGKEGPDEERANFGRNVGAPSPVGLYPAGNGPYGHCDLAGNVWEWCCDEVGSGSEESRRKYGPPRALRGGGWFGVAEYLQSACRLRDHATNRLDGVGFRVAVVPASTLEIDS